MHKYDIAMYLVNLHTLLQAQEATGIPKSTWLLEEYQRTWDRFKETLDETRKRAQQPRGNAPGNTQQGG